MLITPAKMVPKLPSGVSDVSLFVDWMLGTKLILIFAIVFFLFQLAAGELRPDSIMISKKENLGPALSNDSAKVFNWKSSTSVYFELPGKGFYSLNVDFRKTKLRAWSIGMQVAEDGFIPSKCIIILPVKDLDLKWVVV
jgi:hypothetical protein